MLTIIACSYALIVLLWFGAYRLWNDSIWWLALLNAFAPVLLAPTLLFVVLGIVFPSTALWISLLPPACISLCLYGDLFWPKSPPGRQATSETFTIMTFNIWYRSHSDASVRAIGQNAVADVVALQELEAPIAMKLINVYGGDYPHHQLHLEPGETQLGIISNYPLTPVRMDHLAEVDFRIQAARVQAPAGEFLLYNIHLRATNIRRYMREGKSIAHETDRSIQKRAQFIERLLADIAERDEPVAVVGDFNSTPQSEVYARMTAQLADAHRTAGWGFGHTFPTHSRDIGLPIPFRFMRLDMVFFSRELVALRSRVGPYHGESDHRPLIATLAWRRECVRSRLPRPID